MALAPKDTGRLVAHALTLAQKVVDADTEVSTIDLQLLSNLNTNQFLNYINLDQQLSTLEQDTEKLAVYKQEVVLLTLDLDQIERQVDALMNVTNELLSWCNELAATKQNK
ncbi:hypothetical protein METBIDRAFT_37960 [Metschnikowia bicuspidata var. bicuspidata NRRL YB-4993]|uniref:Uncharacterized protein n=1 Tax=Metschnikowia bicuspidata var. bicuspidata NRRL YB-4993 TaxID=869754 RepID=A0A1A0HH18_9ASCO|nr:hypothetical protein METBIDRAFT_37960 [Metschnikowia bicuspidata var. bicuspidata NRRL YB-4993]OBA23290.1 hypothetical protein METBIDRAFT_37960 [Metschnikowia bicuspidata var. bicuspidata NRRL YB-4993]